MALLNKKRASVVKNAGCARVVVWAVVLSVVAIGVSVALLPFRSADDLDGDEGRNARRIATKQHQSGKKTSAEKEKLPDGRGKSVVRTSAEAMNRKKTISEIHGTGRPCTDQTEIARSKYDCFEHPSEAQLAFLVNQPVGDMVIGSCDFDEDFISDLKQALVDRIAINEDDSDETIAIKKSVIDVKHELAQRLKDGEDIVEILTTTRNELQRLGIFKEDLAEAIEEVQDKDELTDQEVEDFVKAANMMLEEKGIEPLHFSHTTKMILRTKPLAEDSGEDEGQSEEEVEQ